MRRPGINIFVRAELIFILIFFPTAVYGDTLKASTKELLSPVYRVDKKYKSMKGPQSTMQFSLLESKKPELLWITGYKATMVDADGQSPQLQDFMCHSNLDFVRGPDKKRSFLSRIFTLSQGQTEIHFPEGFGVPLMSDQLLSLTTQVLNHNIEGRVFQVRHKVSVDYIKDSDLKTPMRPLREIAAYGLVLTKGDAPYFSVKEPNEIQHGSGCLLGNSASSSQYKDSYGRIFTGHWVVKPGREVNRTLVTKLMSLPFDTDIHYIAVHLHPFAESLELKDLTAGRTVFKSRVVAPKGKIGIDRVDYFSSAKGVPIFKSHEYELVSVYNNTTQEDQDSMAVMYIYILDKDFNRLKFVA